MLYGFLRINNNSYLDLSYELLSSLAHCVSLNLRGMWHDLDVTKGYNEMKQ
jgi:hypothetical protein